MAARDRQGGACILAGLGFDELPVTCKAKQCCAVLEVALPRRPAMTYQAASQFLPLDPGLAGRFVARALAGLKPRALELLPSVPPDEIRGVLGDIGGAKLLSREEFLKEWEESCERGEQLSEAEWDTFFDELESIAEGLVAEAVSALEAVPALTDQHSEDRPAAKTPRRRERRASASVAAHGEGDSDPPSGAEPRALVLGRLGQVIQEADALVASLLDAPADAPSQGPRVRQVRLPTPPNDLHMAKARKILRLKGLI